MKNLKEFKKLIKFIKEDRKRLIFATTLITLASVLGMSYGFFMGAATEYLVNMNLRMSLMFFGIYFVISIIAFTILHEISILIFKRVEINLSNKLVSVVYQKVLNLPAEAFEVKTSGELINRVTNDTNTLSNTFSQLLLIIINIFASLLVLIYVVINSWLIFFQIVACIMILFFISRYFSPKLKKNDENVKEHSDEYTSLVTESIRGAREIKTLGIKVNVFSEIQKIIKKLLNLRNNQLTTETKYEIATDVIRTLLEVGVFVSCAILVYRGAVSMTFFIAMTFYIYRYTWIINSLTQFNTSYQKVVVSIIRINELIENKLFIDEEFGNQTIDKIKGTVEFKNVTFGYQKNELILKDLNLKLEPNKKLAIVGKSGQGKTTIFNLITKIFNTTSGNILIDGIPINELSEETIRNNIAIIRQEPFIFNKSIKENFKIINPRITLKEIREYTSLAYLDDYIMSLPKKYDTLLGEGGTNLSGGQKQRLAIARALAKKTKIILFDEATSSLDNESQEYIKKTIDNLVKDHTIIIIAHRFSTIKDADQIFVIDNGQVADYGNHDTLLEKNQIYRDLYEKELL